MATDESFTGWALIELFGHRVIYGHITPVTMYGAAFARIDVPTEPPQVEYKNASALYGLRPLSGGPESEVSNDDGDREVWHKRCAELYAQPNADAVPDPVDSDAPRSAS